MPDSHIAKIAVSAATYSLDKPYDYLIPESMQSMLAPGMRVLVPFSRGNRRSEGVVLALADKSEFEKLKPIEICLDERPVLTEAQLKLALWMHDRLFCTVYDAIKTILPAGFWFKPDGERRVSEKTREMIKLTVDDSEAYCTAEAAQGSDAGGTARNT